MSFPFMLLVSVLLLVSMLLFMGLGAGDEPFSLAPGAKLKSLSTAPTASGEDAVNSGMETDGYKDPAATPSTTEGPYFKPNSPERKSVLEPGVVGEKLNLTGRVLTRSGKPVAGVLLDFWQADGNGRYDNVDYKLRGHQFTDDLGRYQLETVIPGEYSGRTRHIHVKVQAPNGPVLTTQLFFPGDEGNQRDSIFRSELLVSFNDTVTDGTSKQARFDFVLDMD